jgi:hypothetical protein
VALVAVLQPVDPAFQAVKLLVEYVFPEIVGAIAPVASIAMHGMAAGSFNMDHCRLLLISS